MYFSDENEKYAALLEFEKKYIQTNNVVAILRYNEASIGDRRFAAIVSEFHESAERLPRILRVSSVHNYPFISTQRDTISVLPFLAEVCLVANCPELHGVLGQPGVTNRLLSPDARTVAINMAFSLPVASPYAISNVTKSVRTLAQQFRSAHPGLQVEFVGSVTQMDAFREASRRETFMMIGVALIVMFALLVMLYREISLSLFLMGLGIFSALAALGAAGWFGMRLNTSTTAVPIVIMLLVIASSVHVTSAFKTLASGPNAADAKDAMRTALNTNLKPIVLVAVTTALGLLSMNFADAPPLNELGNLICLGFLYGLVCLYTLAPLYARSKTKTKVVGAIRLEQPFLWLHQKAEVPTFALSVLVAGVSIAGLTSLTIDEDFVNYFSRDYEFRRGADFASEHLAGPKTLQLDVSSGRGGRIESIAYQRLLRRLAAELSRQDGVAAVYSVSDIVDHLASAFNVTSEELSDDQIGQLLFAYEMSLGKGQDLSEYIDVDRSSTRVTAVLNSVTSQDIINLDAKIRTWFDTNAVPEYSISVTGINVPVAYMAVENVKAMAQAIGVSVVLMSLIVGIAYQNIYLAPLAAIAIAVPVAMGFGLWGWLFGTIGLAASVILAIVIGIVIDDAIHMIGRFHQNLLDGNSRTDAISLALKSVGSAITTTSVALTAGFLVMATSGFEVNRALGLCAALVFGCALLFDMLILPSVLKLAPQPKSHSHPKRRP
jgi:predicted RND superfamily exporter protein